MSQRGGVKAVWQYRGERYDQIIFLMGELYGLPTGIWKALMTFISPWPTFIFLNSIISTILKLKLQATVKWDQSGNPIYF